MKTLTTTLIAVFLTVTTFGQVKFYKGFTSGMTKTAMMTNAKRLSANDELRIDNYGSTTMFYANVKEFRYTIVPKLANGKLYELNFVAPKQYDVNEMDYVTMQFLNFAIIFTKKYGNPIHEEKYSWSKTMHDGIQHLGKWHKGTLVISIDAIAVDDKVVGFVATLTDTKYATNTTASNDGF